LSVVVAWIWASGVPLPSVYRCTVTVVVGAVRSVVAPSKRCTLRAARNTDLVSGTWS
jgi:hypothetical protein